MADDGEDGAGVEQHVRRNAAGVRTLLRVVDILAAELKTPGVRVNAVVPAIIDTPENRKSLPAKLIEKAVAPAEIAAVIADLCSDAAQAVTGTAIPVYGRY